MRDDGGQKTENGGQKTEDRKDENIEYRTRNAAFLCHLKDYIPRMP